MATQKGNFVVWGNATGLTGASAGAITGYSRNSSLEDATSILKEIPDAYGKVGTIVAEDERYDLTVDVVPYAAANEAGAAAMFKLPAILEVVTVTGPASDGAPTIAGKYYFISGTKTLGGEEGQMSWRLRRYLGNTLPAQT